MRRIFFLLIVLAFVSLSWADAINFSYMTTAENLAQTLVGTGITVSNVFFVGTYSSAGTYTDANADIAQGNPYLESGIVLTSGEPATLKGESNLLPDHTGIAFTSGDEDLNALIPGYSTLDAVTLEFDFSADGIDGEEVTSSFWYIFGSEEYNEFVGSQFNDVFGFFLDGNMIATLPGSTTPIAINNVNNDLNSDHYNDNTTGLYSTEMDGFTTPLYVEFTVPANEEHHMKLAIADAGDRELDSWVLLGAESFINQPADPIIPDPPNSVPEPSTLACIGFGLCFFIGRKIKK